MIICRSFDPAFSKIYLRGVFIPSLAKHLKLAQAFALYLLIIEK
ncbi:MAG: hypothetical protein V7L17_11905 [Nostoc sp.]